MALILALFEGGVLFAAVAASIFLWARPFLFDWLDVLGVLEKALSLSLCCTVAFYYNDLYDFRIVRRFTDYASRLLQAFGVSFMLLAAFYTLFPETRVAQGAFVSSVLLIAGVLVPLRALAYAVMRSRPLVDRVLILGTSPLAHRILAEIEAQPTCRYRVVGVADDAEDPATAPVRVPLLGPLARLDKIVDELTPHRIIVALADRRGRLPVRALLDARVRGIEVEDGIAVYERLTRKLAIESLTPSVLIFSKAFRKSRFQVGARRLVSLLTAALGGLVSLPLMLLVALAIKVDSRGPVFFVQERAGLDGRAFRLIKFRTMRERPAAAPESVWAREDDAGRLTRIGRWLRTLRLDELPQVWNILRGDMDLIGPRPEMAGNVKTMTEQIPFYALRHVVRPGLTGWAQIRQGYAVSLDAVTEKMRYDLYYITHMSLWLDLRILADTVKIVLFGRGAR